MNMFRNFSLRAKLVGLCVMLSLVSVLLSVIAYQGIGRVENKYDQVSDKALPKLQNLNDMFLAYRSVRINLRTLGLPGLSPSQSAEAVSHTKEAIEAYEKSSAAYREIPFIKGEQELYDGLNATWVSFKEVGAKALEYHASGTAESKEKLMQIFLEHCPKAAKEYTVAVNKLKEFHTLQARNDTAEAKAEGHAANNLLLMVSISGILAGLLGGFFLATGISKTINDVVNLLNNNADQVNAASTRVAASSSELSQATTEQAASLEQTASSLEQIRAMITKSSESATVTSQSSLESQKKAEEGRASVDQMLSSMAEINQSNEEIMKQVIEGNQKMAEIVVVIEEIGNKTKVINDIVFQTKLLSFNASVEAARAGEHGKGFAVVAEEVGNLAQMSGNAAKEISALLDGSISKVNTIVGETKTKVEAIVGQGKAKVEAGVQVAQKCSETLKEIVQNVNRVSGLAQEISSASQEQTQGVNEIHKAMSQLDVVTQNNATATQETAGAAEELSSQAISMKSAVSELTKVVNGNSHSNEPSADQPKKGKSDRSGGKKGEVLTFTPKAAAKAAKPERSLKRAAGDNSVPGQDDDRFEEI